MKVRKIVFFDDPVLENIELDFTNKNRETVNTVIIAGENGTGKSYLFNKIFELAEQGRPGNRQNEKRLFEIEFNENELQILKTNENLKVIFASGDESRIFSFSIDYNITNYWEKISIIRHLSNGTQQKIRSDFFAENDIQRILKTVFSDVEVNYTSNAISTVTAKNMDEKIVQSKRSDKNLATEITQLLIDVQSVDALEFTEWARSNSNKLIEDDKIDVRIKRFTTAFDFMFPTKKYKRIENIDNYKQVVFEEHGKEMNINKLSSGEKQIVFRRSFLLKDKESSKGALILIDEPEISLHPNWQLKVLNFFKKLFTNVEGEQTSQLIIATHSPFIIHNANRKDDKVIVLKKDNTGKTIVLQEPKFYSWSFEQIVHEAFEMNNVLSDRLTTIFLEGETDEMYFIKCQEIFEKDNFEMQFKWIGRINDKGHAENTGDTALNQARTFFLANMDQIKGRVILFYDSDTNKPDEKVGDLLIRKMKPNRNNHTYKKGVENLLNLITEIDVLSYYKVRNKIDDYGAESIIR